MADFVSKLKLDASGFVKGIKTALDSAEELKKPIEVEVDADASKAVKSFATLEKQAKEKISGIEDALRDMAVAGGKDTKAFKDLQEQLRGAREEADQLAKSVADIEPPTKGLDKLKDSVKGIGEGVKGGGVLGGLQSALGGLPPQAAAAGAAIAAVAAVTAKAVGSAREFQLAQREVGIATGLSGQALEDLADTARNAYIGGVGESASEALKIVGQLKTTLGDSVPTNALDDVAKKSSQVAKSLGIETPELVAKLSPLIKQYGLDFDSALNLVSGSLGKGIEDVGGYLDAIKEFTPNAKEAGLSADEFAGRLQKAGELGVKDLAKVGDGYKELNNRIKSGDLSAQVGAIGGAVGKQLQEIAKLAQEGTITADEAAQRSTKLLDDAAKKGEITAQTQAKGLTALFGSIGEDLGNDVTTKIFSGKVDVAKVKANSAKAGAAIADGVGKQDPFEKLSKSADVLLEGFGKPILDAMNKIGDSIGKLFGNIEDGGDGIQKFGEFLGTFIANAVDNLRGIIDFAVELKKEVGAIIDFFSSQEDGAEAAAKAQEKQVEATKKNKKAQEDLVAEATELAKKNGLSEDAVAALAKKYGISVDEAKKLVGESTKIADASKAAATDVNNLAASFNNALSAAQASTATYTAGIAQALADGNNAIAKSLTAQAREEVKAQKRLEKLQDTANLRTDSPRKRQLAEQERQRQLETAKQAELINANLIVNTRKRAEAQLEIEQRYARLTLAEQVKTQKTIIAAGGAGIPEAVQALKDLQAQQTRGLKDQQQQRLDLQRSFFDEDLQLSVDRETKRRDVLLALTATTQELLTRQLNFGDLTGDNVQAIADAAARQVKLQTEAEVRASIEATQAFVRGKDEIVYQAKIDGASVEETQRRIDALALSLTQAYVDANNDPELQTEFTKSIVALIKKGEAAGTDASLSILKDGQARRIAFMQDGFLRERAVAVDALENERDDLLRNEKLTQESRLKIIEEYARRIRRANATGIDKIGELAVGIGAAFKGLNFTFEQTGASAEDVAKQIEDINKALRDGEITYQEAAEKLAALEQSATGVGAVIQQVGEQLAKAVADTTSAFAQAQIDQLAKVMAEYEELKKNGIASLGELKEKEKEVNAQREAAYASVGAAAVAAFATAVVSGEDAGKSLIKVALDTLDALVPILVAQITGIQLTSPLAALDFGIGQLAAAAALTGILKGLVAAAKASAGFKDGGYTGNGGVNDVAGVVHGKEFVVNAQAVANPLNRAVLEAMNSAGGKSVAWVRDNAPQVDTNAIIMDTSRIVATEIGSLRNEFSSLRSDVQALGVSINRNVSVQGNFVAKGSDLRAIVNIERRKQQLRGAR